MSDIVIRAENLSKQYRLGPRERYKTLRDAITKPFRPSSPSRETFWALKDVSFEISQGEVVGIIGRNGAGKSTLLKILSRITEPTAGFADVQGRIGSLLEVGTGFHPELTGRENIYLNGAILGMRKSEIDAKFDEIVAFAETEQFLDTVVKHYSSGMRVRLAFAVAAHLEPEILLVDEVLAVGDAAFQKKCLGKMDEVAKAGRTVFFVSHNMAATARLCSRGLYLEQGQLAYDGTVDDAIQRYQTSMAQNISLSVSHFPTRTGSGLIQFKEVVIRNEDGSPQIRAGCAVTIAMKLMMQAPFRSANVKIAVGINSSQGDRVATLMNKFEPNPLIQDGTLQDGTTCICRLPRLALRPSLYFLTFYIDINGETSDVCKDALQLEVHETDFYGSGVMPTSSQGPMLVDQTWEYTNG